MLGRRQAAQFLGRSSGPFGIPNSLGAFMALLIPPVGFMALHPGRPGRRALWAAALCLLAAGFVLAVSRGAWLALAGAFALRAMLAPGHGLGRRLGSAATTVAAAAALGGIVYLAFPLMRERVDQLVSNAGERSRPAMWRAAWRIFEAHPAVGSGAGSYDTAFEGFRPVGNLDQPTYAHSDYLNTLSDYGAVGFLLLFAAGGLVARRWLGAPGLAGAAATGLVAFGLHLLVDFDLKIPALAMIAATVAALLTSETWPGQPVPGAPRWARPAALGAAAAILAATGFWAIPRYRADEARRRAREQIDAMAQGGDDMAAQRDGLARIRTLLADAVRLDPWNAQAWSDSAYADSLWAFVQPAQTRQLGAEAERQAGRAVALGPAVAEFWIRLGVGLDMEGSWIKAGDCFVRALRIAPGRPDCWYYQAYHLSRDPAQIAAAFAAADYALRLDPGYLLAQALRQRLGERPKPTPLTLPR
jgi:O-antigen ligase